MHERKEQGRNALHDKKSRFEECAFQILFRKFAVPPFDLLLGLAIYTKAVWVRRQGEKRGRMKSQRSACEQ